MAERKGPLPMLETEQEGSHSGNPAYKSSGQSPASSLSALLYRATRCPAGPPSSGYDHHGERDEQPSLVAMRIAAPGERQREAGNETAAQAVGAVGNVDS